MTARRPWLCQLVGVAPTEGQRDRRAAPMDPRFRARKAGELARGFGDPHISRHTTAAGPLPPTANPPHHLAGYAERAAEPTTTTRIRRQVDPRWSTFRIHTCVGRDEAPQNADEEVCRDENVGTRRQPPVRRSRRLGPILLVTRVVLLV